MRDEAMMVSVVILVYNHEQFIAQNIEGILAQQCNFKYEVIIGEDCSKDNSREVIMKYASQYPDIIKPILHKVNVGAKANAAQCLEACTGKYIGNCEGDDYWTDPTKLQREIDYLEANPDYTLVFSNVDIVDQIGLDQPNPYPVLTKDVFGIEDIITADKVFIPTPAMTFRNILPSPLPRFLKEAISGDIALHLIMADKGKIKKLPGKTAVYRQHGGGITKSKFVIDNAFIAQFKLYEDANAYFEYRYNSIFRKQLFEMSKTILIYGSRVHKGFGKLKYVANNVSRYFKYQDRLNLKEIFYYACVIFFPWVLKSRKGAATT